MEEDVLPREAHEDEIGPGQSAMNVREVLVQSLHSYTSLLELHTQKSSSSTPKPRSLEAIIWPRHVRRAGENARVATHPRAPPRSPGAGGHLQKSSTVRVARWRERNETVGRRALGVSTDACRMQACGRACPPAFPLIPPAPTPASATASASPLPQVPAPSPLPCISPVPLVAPDVHIMKSRLHSESEVEFSQSPFCARARRSPRAPTQIPVCSPINSAARYTWRCAPSHVCMQACATTCAHRH